MSENSTDATMGNQQETDVAWLAGIFDGEGTITVTRNGSTKHPEQNARKTEMTIPNGDERMILKIIIVLESLGIKPYVTCLEPASHQRLKRWRVGVTKRTDISTLSGALIPYLSCKREQAILLKRYVDSRIKRETENGNRLTRKPISEEEKFLGDKIVEFNNPLSGSSQTVREGAKNELRMIQSGLTRNRERVAEMTTPAS